MPLPKPEPGLVIHYDYIWRDEPPAGEARGPKRRPCAVVIAVPNSAGEQRVVVAPITRTELRPPAEGIEIPARLKKFLGLDNERSWVVVSDLNEFAWPGIAIHPLPGRPLEFEYGFLPPQLFEVIRARIEQVGAEATPRTE